MFLGSYLGPGLYLEGVSLARLQVSDCSLALSSIEVSGFLWDERLPIVRLWAPLDRETGYNPVGLEKKNIFHYRAAKVLAAFAIFLFRKQGLLSEYSVKCSARLDVPWCRICQLRGKHNYFPK